MNLRSGHFLSRGPSYDLSEARYRISRQFWYRNTWSGTQQGQFLQFRVMSRSVTLSKLLTFACLHPVLPDAFGEKNPDLGFWRKKPRKFKIAKNGGIFLAQKTSKKVIYYYKKSTFSKKVKNPKKYLLSRFTPG